MNKKYLKIIFLGVALTLFFACQKSESNQSNSNVLTTNAVEKQIYKAVGIIKKIDADAPKLTVDHEDIRGYMTAMTMDFDMRDKNLIGDLKIGDRIDFELERTGEKIVITKIIKIGEIAVLNGGEIYKVNCAECHGSRGEGTKKGLSFLKGHALHHSEAEFIKQVTNGEGEKMPAFNDKLSAEHIAEVVKFVRADLQKISEKKLEKHSHH